MTESQWISSGMFSQDSPHCSSSTESKSSETKWATQRNSKDEVSSCRCSMTSLCLYLQKDFQQDVGHSSDLDQKRSGILLTTKDHEENGTESLNDDDRIRRKRTPSFPSHESIVPRNAQKQRRWKIIDTLLCRWDCDWNCFFRTIISANQLSIYGAVSDLCEEYSACSTRTGRPVLAGQSDPLFEPAKVCWWTTPTPSIEVPAQEILLQKYKERVERLSQQNRCD